MREKSEAARQSRFGQFNGHSGGPDPETRVVHRSEPHDTYIGRGDGGAAHLNNTEIGVTGWLGNPYKTKAGGATTRASSRLRCIAPMFSTASTTILRSRPHSLT